MTKKSLSVLAGAIALLPAFVCAQETAQPAEVAVAAPAPEAAGSPWSFDIEVKYLTAYYSRGYNYGDEMLIIQPQGTVAYEAYATDDLTITPWFNVWANVTDEEYSGMDYWDELDLTPGVDFGFGRYTLSALYTWYMSPADGWEDIHEVGLALAFDDTDLLGLPIALNPYAGIYYEFEDKGGPEGTYAEVGLKPEWVPLADRPITLTFPMALGLNVDDFYWDEDGDEETLGFWSVGLVARYDITDNWYATVGVKYVQLLADSVQASNDDESNETIGHVSLGLTF